MIWCYLLIGLLAAVVSIFGILDIYYFIRMGLCVLYARYMCKKIHILDTTKITGKFIFWMIFLNIRYFLYTGVILFSLFKINKIS